MEFLREQDDTITSTYIIDPMASMLGRHWNQINSTLAAVLCSKTVRIRYRQSAMFKKSLALSSVLTTVRCNSLTSDS